MDDKKVIEELKRQGFEVDNDIVAESIVSIATDEPKHDFEDIKEICREYNKDENIFKMGNTRKIGSGNFWDALLASVGDVPSCSDKKKRYWFARRVRYHFAVNRGAIDARHAEGFVGITDGLLGFKGAIAYREAGVPELGLDDEKKKNRLGRILGNK